MSELDDEVVAGRHLRFDGGPEVGVGVELTGVCSGFAAVIDGDKVGIEERTEVHSPAAFVGG